MPEKTFSSPPQPPAPKKRERRKTVLTVIFLIISPPIGLILTWALAPWRRNIKIIVTAVIGGLIVAIIAIGILATIVLVTSGEIRGAATDAWVVSTMNKIRLSAEMHYYENDNSYQGVDCLHSEIAVFCKEIEARTGREVTIYAVESAYCTYTELTSGEYYCIDSQLRTGETLIYPGGTGYCDGSTFVCP